MTPSPVNSSLELAQICARAAYDIKAEDIHMYDLRDTSSVTNYVVICTGLSIPHLRAILREVEKTVFEETGIEPVYLEDKPNTLWSVMDYIDVMVHIMGEDAREFYQLERVWKDAAEVELDFATKG